MTLEAKYTSWKRARANDLFSLSFEEWIRTYGSYQDNILFNRIKAEIEEVKG